MPLPQLLCRKLESTWRDQLDEFGPGSELGPLRSKSRPPSPPRGPKGQRAAPHLASSKSAPGKSLGKGRLPSRASLPSLPALKPSTSQPALKPSASHQALKASASQPALPAAAGRAAAGRAAAAAGEGGGKGGGARHAFWSNYCDLSRGLRN